MMSDANNATSVMPIVKDKDVSDTFTWEDFEDPKSSGLGELAKIYSSEKPSSALYDAPEFLFLREGKWYKVGKEISLVSMTEGELKELSASSKYVLTGPISKEDGGFEHYALYRNDTYSSVHQ